MSSRWESIAMLGVAAALLSVLPAVAVGSSWSVCGHVDADIPGEHVRRVTTCDIPRTSWADGALVVGEALNAGEVEVRGDVAKGRVQLSAYAQNNWNAIEQRWEPATAAGSVLLQGTETFTVAPGSYPDGAYAYADGSARGEYLWILPADLQVHYQVYFGGVTDSFDLVVGAGDPPGGGRTIEQTFTLSRELVKPGRDVLTPQVFELDIYAKFETSGAGAWAQPYEAMGHVDFWDDNDWTESVGFTRIRTSEGVTWVASGVFLTSPIPAPAAVWLMGGSLSVLALLLRRRRRSPGAPPSTGRPSARGATLL